MSDLIDGKLAKDTNVPINDVISRRAAIDEIDEWIKAFRENGHKESAADACLIQDGIIQLPSAQPEIIRCKDCRWQKDQKGEAMSDLIERQAAIDAFKPYAGYESNRTNAEWVHRIELVLHDMPSAQPEITEDDVKEFCRKRCLIVVTSDFYDEMTRRLPSAQPDIVRCKDCKYWGIHKRLNIPWCREMHIDRGADDFCSYAERRTDERQT